MKRTAILLTLGILFISVFSQPLWAGEVDILIKKLVEKKILTQSEAKELLGEIQREAAKEKPEKEVAKKTKLPKWVEKTKLKGDFRLRYQGEEVDNNPQNRPHRSRGRVRLRLGVESQVSEQWKVGFGIASGGADGRSTNETLDNFFESPDLRIDYAYAQYKPYKFLGLSGGKFKNPLWGTKDLLWDGDIRPEGGAITFDFNLLPNLQIFATPAFFILDESSRDTGDPNMWVFQPGVKWKFRDNMYVKFAPAYYATDNIAGTAGGPAHIDGLAFTNNSVDNAGNRLYEYNAISLDAELGVNKIPGPVPFIAVFGQYVNSDADTDIDQDGFDDDEGWLVGIKVGHQKVNKFARWQAKYNYRRLERDAWPDFLPDSDFFGGDTNVKGHEVELKFGLHKYVSMGLDYYHTEPIRFPAGRPKIDEDIIQIDLLLKF